MEVHGSGVSGQRARNQFRDHERVILHVEFAVEAEPRRDRESEARVERWMPDNEDRFDTQPAAFLKPCPNQCAADSTVLA